MSSQHPTPLPGASAASAEAAASKNTAGTSEAPAVPVSASGSKQLRWQKKQEKKNRCRQCGKPLLTRHHCADCAEKIQIRNRNNYRLKVGIPLDAPLDKKGRPRIGGSTVQVASSRLELAEPSTCNLSPSTSHQP